MILESARDLPGMPREILPAPLPPRPLVASSLKTTSGERTRGSREDSRANSTRKAGKLMIGSIALRSNWERGRLDEQLRGKPLTFVAAVFIVRLTSKIKEALLRARAHSRSTSLHRFDYALILVDFPLLLLTD
jgi:hypothetical protein